MWDTMQRRFCWMLLLVGGCHSWRATSLAPDDRVLSVRSRVVKTDGQTVELEGGRAIGDSVVGIRRKGGGSIAVPRDSVAAIEERRPSWGRTLGLTAAVWLGAALLLADRGVATD